MRSGYLIPTDRQGNLLRVCPTLDTQSWRWRSIDTESRQRRRIARRGKTQLTTVADRKAMRRGILQDKSLHNVDDKRMVSRRRYRTQLASSPARSMSMRERKSSDKRESNKSKAIVRKNKLVDNFILNIYCNFPIIRLTLYSLAII